MAFCISDSLFVFHIIVMYLDISFSLNPWFDVPHIPSFLVMENISFDLWEVMNPNFAWFWKSPLEVGGCKIHSTIQTIRVLYSLGFEPGSLLFLFFPMWFMVPRDPCYICIEVFISFRYIKFMIFNLNIYVIKEIQRSQ